MYTQGKLIFQRKAYLGMSLYFRSWFILRCGLVYTERGIYIFSCTH